MGFWKAKVVPRVKKLFEKDSAKKAAAAEASKSFDDSKEEIDKEFEEKKEGLQPKVLEIYEASSAEVKTAVKERTVAAVKKQGTAVSAFLEELVKIEFPGAKAVSEASAKFGPALVPGPVFFLFEKVAVFLPAEEPKAPAAEEAPPAPAAPAEESSTKEKEAAVEEVKEEEEKAPAPEAAAPPPAAPATVPEPAKEAEPADPPPKA
ncbi:unnamed protein product [Spirodela intermedia]|uniref:Uncharacterized protein n=1 Tax=Spirodela intermedia TaxID=51605 RepID=A0A7I8KJ72_SPIIN|nr:unnamed protein product [Spirodela intermedia]